MAAQLKEEFCLGWKRVYYVIKYIVLEPKELLKSAKSPPLRKERDEKLFVNEITHSMRYIKSYDAPHH